MGLLAAGLLVSGLSAVPMSVSAASSNYSSYNQSSWLDWTSYWNNDNGKTVSSPYDNTTDDNKDQGNGNTEQTTNNAGNGSVNTENASDEIEKVIADGMKYLGTPYEFGSDRSTSKTFDCSDF